MLAAPERPRMGTFSGGTLVRPSPTTFNAPASRLAGSPIHVVKRSMRCEDPHRAVAHPPAQGMASGQGTAEATSGRSRCGGQAAQRRDAQAH